MSEYLDIVTSFAFYDGLDEKPIRKALESHNQNNKIKRLHVVSESKQKDLLFLLDKLENLEIHFVEQEVRPTFDVLITYVNELLSNKKTTHVALVNGDVSFENEVAVNNTIKLFDKKNVNSNTVIALSRHEYVDDKLQITLKQHNGLPNFISADAWVFNKPCLLNYSAFYSMGQMNCDLMLACDLVNAGYHVINPCLDTVIIHHEDEIKSDSFYAEQNAKDNVKNVMYSFMASRVNLDYTVTTPTWIKSAWLEYGYNPQGYKFNNEKSIWVLFNHDVSNVTNKFLLQVLDVISTNYKQQINIVVEGSIGDELIHYYDEVLRRNKRIYFHSVDKADDFISSALTGEVNWSNSLVLLSDISRLSKNLLETYSEFLLDLRWVSKDCDLYALDGELLGFGLIWCLNERYGYGVGDKITILSDEDVKKDRKCSLITSVFQSDVFIDTFIENCENLVCYENIDHFYLISNLSTHEKASFSKVISKHRNSIFISNKKDPGLYECWNIGIRLAITEYVSNANVDDLRDPTHIKKLSEVLTNHPDVSVAASALYPFYEFSGNLESHIKGTPWYSDMAGIFSFDNLAMLENKDSKNKLKANNLPHCMPVWRKSIHDDFDYFDERTFGTFADWAFWLKITMFGAKGYLLGEGLGFYFVNLESHNRRGDKLELFHKKVETEFMPHFVNKESKSDNVHEQDKSLETKSLHSEVASTASYPQKLKIFGVDLFYGQHRHGFNKLIESLLPLHSDNSDILFIPFIERYFVWGAENGEAASKSPSPIMQDWVGIIHVPFDAPDWFHSDVYPEVIFEKAIWKDSMPRCKGIIALSEDLRRDVQFKYPELPTFALKFPTIFEDNNFFDYQRFCQSPTIIQAGDWLRKLTAIHQLDALGYRKVMLLKDYTAEYLNRELVEFDSAIDKEVEMLTMVPNDEYDRLLSSSIVLCWLYATAANNLVIECIARHTPIIINPLPSVVEYLGEEYPLYIDHLSEANQLLADQDKILAASKYLKKLSESKMKHELSYENFFYSLAKSDFYKNL